MGYLRPSRLMPRLGMPSLGLLLGDLIPVSGGTVMRVRYKCSVLSVSVSASSGRMPAKGIVREDDPATRVYEIISGTVCTTKMLRDGRRQVGGFYFSGDVFGLEAAVKHSLAAQAITDVRVRIVKKQTLSALALSDCKVAGRLLSLTARELARKQSLALLLSRTAQERLIGFIAEMAQHGSSKGDRIALPMTRQDIADYLGLTIETVSRILHDLERRGAIKIKGYNAIVLRGQFVVRGAEELADLFEGIKDRQPKTKQAA